MHEKTGGDSISYVDDQGIGALPSLQDLDQDAVAAPRQVPIVRYLRLGESPHLFVEACTTCGARFFERRDACASCGEVTFDGEAVEPTGIVRAFTFVHVAGPGVAVPFVSAVVDCAGTSVRASLINVPVDLDHVRLGMPVQLATYSLGLDDRGVEAIGFGFEPQTNGDWKD